MKTFYSLIKVSPNPTAGDLFTVGIIVSDLSGVYIQLSNNKLKIAHHILNENYVVVDFVLKQLNSKVVEANRMIVENKTVLFENNHIFDYDYFEYLNRYSNNLIQFSKPFSLFEAVSSENLKKLYSLLVDSEIETDINYENHQESLFKEKIGKNLISRVKNKVHTKVNFDDKIIPSLYFHFEMDCIGLNGCFTGAKSLYFNKPQTIHSQVSDYITLITEIEKKYNRFSVENKFYLISDEPLKQSKGHMLWEKLRSLTKIKLIVSDEAGEVAEHIEKSGATTFLE